MVTSRNLVVFLSSFLILLFSFSCDLFQPADPDYLKKIDEEVEWALAAKLTVTVTFPNEWGTSPQTGTNRCYDKKRTDKNPRQGYAFTVQFNPNAAYGDAQWRAYRTDDLPQGSNWYINEASIKAVLQELDNKGKRLTSDEVDFSPSIGSASSITLNIPDAVTIIPYSQKQPRIISSSPPVTATSETYARAPNNPITVTFAAPVDIDTLKFETGFIEICGKDLASGNTIYGAPDMGGLFAAIFYDADIYTLTIQSGGSIPEGIIVEVTLGTGIKSVGEDIGMAQEAVFSYRTVSSELAITEWKASYSTSKIEVNWTLPAGASGMTPVAKYRRNNGLHTVIDLEGEKEKLIIENVSPPDSSGVTNGQPVSGVNSYTITLELGDDVTTIVMYNIPGLEINHDDYVLINKANVSELYKPENFAKNILLTEDIVLNEHTPIGGFSVPFTGNFYGNGFTVTITGFDGNGVGFADLGLFGVTGTDALVRDVTVMYNNVSITAVEARWHYTYDYETQEPPYYSSVVVNVTRFGGIAGVAYDGSSFENVLSKGDVNISGGGSNHKYTGCIVGDITGGTVQNTRSELKLTLANGGIITGGIAGYVTETILDKCVFTGKIIVSSDNRATAGGIIGYNDIYSGNIIISDCLVENGNIDINANEIKAGGVYGISDTYNINSQSNRDRKGITIAYNTYFNGGTITINSSVGGNANVQAGGFCSIFNENDKISNSGVMSGTLKVIGGRAIVGGFCGINSSTLLISNCFSRMDILVNCTGEIEAGGFAGRNYGTRFSKCYAAGMVSVVQSGDDYSLFIGGFIGNNNGSITDCYALGNVFAEKTGGGYFDYAYGAIIFAGGFAGFNSDEISNCFSMGQVIAKSKQTNIFAGGIAGFNYIGTNIGIKATAALGNLVYAAGDSQYTLYGRIVNYDEDYYYLYNDPDVDNKLYHNYANTNMWIGSGDYDSWSFIKDADNCITGYGEEVFSIARYPQSLPHPNVRLCIHSNKHDQPMGADNNAFNSRSFWRGDLELNFKFDTDYWLFTTVEARGYPILRGADVNFMPGPPLPGQE